MMMRELTFLILARLKPPREFHVQYPKCPVHHFIERKILW
uniref:Uncharacterized protein n=1 Tax=Rhizophora mucronata TaxID=61149 RepID=A0A2P2PWE6_RHIMU